MMANLYYSTTDKRSDKCEARILKESPPLAAEEY